MIRATGATLVCAVATVVLGVSTAIATPAEPLGHAGRWITDAEGRVVVLHGYNAVPLRDSDPVEAAGMTPEAIEGLADRGFNVIRLGLYYAQVEPTPGEINWPYIDSYVRVQRDLAERGMFTLLDMHQDQLNRNFGGGPVPGARLPSRGFPDWFVKTDGVPSTRVDYPAGYVFDPALNRAYDNLWRDFPAPDGVSVQEHFARGWQAIIGRFRDNPGILGYDLFNEPWPGSAAATCANPVGCPPGGFDQTLLTAFFRRIARAAAAADPHHLVFYEPNLNFDFGAQTRVGSPGIPNAGFAFHDYCIGDLAAGPAGMPSHDLCRVGEEMVMRNAEAHARSTGDALFMGEAGFDPPAVARLAELADRYMVGWAFWAYDPNWSYYRDGLPILVRPYPQLVSGTPRGWSFDRESKTFTLRYSTARADGSGRFPAGSRTEIFVPRLHYPDGYRADVSGASVASTPTAGRVVLCSLPQADEVTVAITPDRGSTTELPHAASDPACAPAAGG